MSAPAKTIQIVSAYEGLSGLHTDGKYYPYHVEADEKGLLTVGRGHLLTNADCLSGRFNHGLTLEQVNDLFGDDLAPRELVLKQAMGQATDDQFAAALSMFYNNEESWTRGTPITMHRQGKYKLAAQGMLLYINSNGQKQLGLWRRRMSEALCYLTGQVIIAHDPTSEHFLYKVLCELIPINRPKF